MRILLRAISLLYCLLWFGVGAVVAEGGSSDGVATAAFKCQGRMGHKALEAALAKVQKRYQGISGVRARFYQDSYLAALNTAESSGGSVVFSKPGRMKWSYARPEPQEFVLREQTIWFYQPEIQQLLVDELSEVLLTDLPVAFLMGVGKLSEGFSLAGGCAGSNGTVIKLDPNG
ncbi:MAG: outer membrane lipoprotein carrier protein LolA, partial [Proteobacteria bacterium]|nr:outer membrane lipoprotein carrier protein LolA [Pseudomonadota bacterium]